MFRIKRVSDNVSRSFRMRICHVSDTHGYFPKLSGAFDVVVHSGDLFPNKPHNYNPRMGDLHSGQSTNSVKEMAFQMDWLGNNISMLKKWLQGRDLLFILGNHDFAHNSLVEQALNAEGIKAISLHDKVVKYKDVTFYGFPYVPPINGMFAYEKELPEMNEEVDKMVEVLNAEYVDVLVTHAPLYKVLDLTRGNSAIGSSVLSSALDYKINKDMRPSVMLHGHCHESNGLAMYNEMLVSNAATVSHIIEVQ